MRSEGQPARCDLLLEAGTVVTLDPERPVIACGFVAITGEKIVAVGPKEEASPTTGGAAALGIDAGRLAPGALADVIVLDTSRAHLTPVHDPRTALVYAARGSDVATNIVGGQVIVEDGRCTPGRPGRGDLRSERP